MPTIKHQTVWKNNPAEKKIFVSYYVHHTFPTLDKNPRIKKVLDVGCGNGMGVVLPLLRRGLEVHCFDHHASAINAVHHNVKNACFQIHTKKACMYHKFPYKDNSFDSTFCFQAIYHGKLEKIMTALSEIKRVTKKGGYFFGTFLADIMEYDSKTGEHFFKVKLSDGRVIRAYHLQDKKQPHFFYNLTKDYEYKVGHYYFSKEELRVVLKQFFSDVQIKKVFKKYDPYTRFWFVACKV